VIAALGYVAGLIPRWIWLSLGALAIACLCAWSWRAGAQYERGQWQAKALAQAQADAAETARRIKTLEEARRAAEIRTHQALADAAAAGTAAERLRQQVAAFRAAHPPAAGGSAPAGDPIGVLADVLGRCDANQGVIARFADAAREAGRLCEQSYDTLTGGE